MLPCFARGEKQCIPKSDYVEEKMFKFKIYVRTWKA